MSTPTLASCVFGPSRLSKRQVLYAIAVVSALEISPFLFWATLADRIFTSNFLLHCYCHLGPGLVTHVAASFLIGFADVAIAATLGRLVYKAHHYIRFDWIFLAFIPFMVACGAISGGGGNVMVSVSPANVTLFSNQKQQFTATVSGASNAGVTWSATAGSVDASGLYTAPTVNSKTNVVVTATSTADSTKSASAAATIDPVVNPPLQITTGSLPQGQQGVAYSEVFTATGGAPPYSWSISAGTPPAGIQMNANGDLAGTPTATGTFNFTVMVTDASNLTATGNFSVTVVAGSGSGGPPLTYAARTDPCIFGTEVGCPYGALIFQMRTTDTAPFASYPNAQMNAMATDPDFHSTLVMATDWTTEKPTRTWVVQTGVPPFSQDSSMLWLYNTDKGGQLFLLSATAVAAAEAAHSSTCTGCISKVVPIHTGAVQPSCGTGCTLVDSTGSVSWSTVPDEGNVLYELAGNNTSFNRLVIQPGCTASSCTFSRTLVTDMISNGALPSGWVTTGWNGNIVVANDGSLTYMTGGGAPWVANTAYYSLANDTNSTPTSFVWPPKAGHNNSAGNAFQAVTTGNSYSSEPVWSDATLSLPYICDDGTNSVSATLQTCGSGYAQWYNIGTIAGQGPGFDILDYRAGIGSSHINTLIGKVYRGAGNSEPSGSWTTDDNTICPEYGVTYPNPCPFPDLGLSLHDGTTKNPQYAGFTPMGGGGACPVPGTCSCAVTNATYLGQWCGSNNSACSTPATYSGTDTIYDPINVPHSLYESVASSTNVFPYCVTGSEPGCTTSGLPYVNSTYWQRADRLCYTHFWDRPTTIVRPLMCRGSSSGGDCDGHATDGQIYELKAANFNAHLYSRPSDSSSGPPWANPGFATMPSPGPPADSHSTWWNSGSTDSTPWGLANTDVPTSNYCTKAGGTPSGSSCTSPSGSSLWYGEFDMALFNSLGPMAMYRMFHEFNTGSNAGYSQQNNMTEISPDGQWALATTDMMGTRGSTSADWKSNTAYALGATVFPIAGGQNTNNYGWYASTAGTSCNLSGCSEPAWDSCTTTCPEAAPSTLVWTREVAACNQLRAFYAPAKNTAFTSGLGPGSSIFPVDSNSNFDIFTATQSGTTYYSSIPNWDSATAGAPNWGDTVCDDASHEQNVACSFGVVQWLNVGANDCRADVILVDLLSAN